MDNVHSSPEKFDLTVVADIELTGASCEFDGLVVWKHKDGRVFYATDSGCSCPTPFEDYNSLESLKDAKLDIALIEETIEKASGLSGVEKKDYIKAIKDSL
jgi:hypothetical protein